MRVRQLYLPETNILITRFLAEEGVAELTDYMPIEQDGEQPNEIVRTVAVIRGNLHFEMRCQPRFNYAAGKHELEMAERCATFRPADSICPPMSLYSTVALEQHSHDVKATFTLKAGEKANFIFGATRAKGQPPEMDLLAHRFFDTAQFWKAWILQSNYKGRGVEMVNRSALLLEAAHQSETWLSHRGTDFLSAGEHWRRAELGLSLHLAAGRSLHFVRPRPVRFR